MTYFLLMAGYDSTEGIDDFELAQSILRNGSLGLAEAKGPIFDKGPDGRKYLAHEIGNPLVMVPAVFIGDTVTRLLPNVTPLDRADRLSSFLACTNSTIWVALTVTFCFAIWTRTGTTRWHALICSLALGFGTMLFPYSKMGTDLVLSCLIVTATFWMLVSSGGNPSHVVVLSIATLLAFGFITRPSLILFVPGVFGYLLYGKWKDARNPSELIRLALIFAIPFFLAFSWQGWYNHLRTGSVFVPPMLQPRYAQGNTFEDATPLYALVSVLFSPGKSLFVYSPVLIFGVLGWRAFCRKHTALAVTLAGMILPYFTFHIFWKLWAGHWGLGPRLFLPLVPLLFLPAGAWMSEARTKVSWRLVFGLALLIQMSAVWNNYQFRQAILVRQGHSVYGTVWDWRYNPAVDSIVNVYDNIQRMRGRKEGRNGTESKERARCIAKPRTRSTSGGQMSH